MRKYCTLYMVQLRLLIRHCCLTPSNNRDYIAENAYSLNIVAYFKIVCTIMVVAAN